MNPSILDQKPASTRVAGALPLTTEQLRQLDVPGPRYTSYPTADRFVEAFGPGDHASALAQRAQGLSIGRAAPLSLYVHIPFCESVCYYCACNKIITRHKNRGRGYLELLGREIDLHVARLGAGQEVQQLHLGGGSPTFLSDGELAELVQRLRQAFVLKPTAEISIEVDPRTADAQRLANWRAMGFNRISLGVQDFDERVQQAVHRVQPYQQVRDLIDAARAQRYESINVDLIYGLPCQTPASLARTIAQVSELRPSRIALYAYAHLPQRFKPQRRIHGSDLPSAEARLAMLGAAIAGFIAQGYVYIGMDHFALPDDALAVAKRQGRLHRNFQGYTTLADGDLIGLGVSSISRVGASYSQNAKTLEEYEDALVCGQFPTVRGLALSRDDLIRRSVIMSLMCQGRVDFESIALAHLVDVRRYFAHELEQLAPLAALGFVTIEAGEIVVTALGWYFVRSVAAVFDKHLQADRTREQFSRII